MPEKITLDMLTKDSVSIKKQNTIQDGKECAVGDIWRKAYVNSPIGRLEIKNELKEPYKSDVLRMWGDSPTMPDVTS